MKFIMPSVDTAIPDAASTANAPGVSGRAPGPASWQRARAAEVVPLGWWERLNITLARARRWEFWPSWLYYGPIVVWILWLGVKHRRMTAFTAANPGLEAGGMVGEKKHQALAPLQSNAPDLAATFILIAPGTTQSRILAADAFAQMHQLPIVLKPDVGQRGRGVYIARSREDIASYLGTFEGAVIAQRYVHGEEFGVFVARHPGQFNASVLSVVHKTFPTVTGNGISTLRDLILHDARARLISALMFERWAAQLADVPALGEVVTLVEIGAHCRGSLFLDGSEYLTDALVATLTRLMDAVPGYAFGRIDLRVSNLADFQQGIGLQVLELNGVSAESAHIYHPGTPLLDGYRAMFRQWETAFSIGAAYARAGVPTTSALTLLRLLREDIARAESWF